MAQRVHKALGHSKGTENNGYFHVPSRTLVPAAQMAPSWEFTNVPTRQRRQTDLNQIPYDYTVEVRNRFKGLDLIECLMNYGRRFVTLYRRHGSDHPHGKEIQKRKMAVWGGLTNIWEKKRSEKQRRKGKI